MVKRSPNLFLDGMFLKIRNNEPALNEPALDEVGFASGI